MDKYCYACKGTLPFDLFYLDKHQSSGYSSACKPCARAIRAARAKTNKDKENVRTRAWAKANPEKRKAIKDHHVQEWTLEQREAHREVCRQYKKNNPAVTRKNGSDYRAAKRKATVQWDTELTDFAHEEAFVLTVLREKLFGFAWELDHIIPLRGKRVSGLHVWNNFQVIPRDLNRKKRNHYVIQ